jgi:hypothetical protein
MGNTTYGESVQPLQSVKLVYQACPWSWAAQKTDRIIAHLMMMFLMMLFLMMVKHMIMLYNMELKHNLKLLDDKIVTY